MQKLVDATPFRNVKFDCTAIFLVLLNFLKFYGSVSFFIKKRQVSSLFLSLMTFAVADRPCLESATEVIS